MFPTPGDEKFGVCKSCKRYRGDVQADGFCNDC